MNYTEDRNVQPGDIRICEYNHYGLIRGERVEIIKPHSEAPNYWHLKKLDTGEVWMIDENFEISAIDALYLQKLVRREEYEVCV